MIYSLPVKQLISISEAQSILLGSLAQISSEIIPLEIAHGRILRSPVLADRPAPPFHRVMMDGIAIRHSSGQRQFRISGTQAAGSPALNLFRDDDCLEVMTGAVLPHGADTVIPIEDIDLKDGLASLRDGLLPSTGQFIHRCGSDAEAGSPLLLPGQKLTAPELAVCASVGATQLECTRLPHIVLFSTGDEVVPADSIPTDYQIRRSHPSALASLVTSSQLATLSHQHLPDDPGKTEAAIRHALSHADFIVLTGGISKGKFDWVAPTLKSLLGSPRFHGVAQRPGKPLGFWKSDTSPPVLALPGNPVSVMATASTFLIPALRQIAGHIHTPPSGLLGHDFHWTPPLEGLLPYQWIDGKIKITPPANSGDYAALTGSCGFAHFPTPSHHYPANSLLTLYPYH